MAMEVTAWLEATPSLFSKPITDCICDVFRNQQFLTVESRY